MHRDLKPSNVLLAADGPRVIDFGISLAIERSMLTATGAVMGSPGFMSPEQARGQREVGKPTDVFSLGAVLAFAATGIGPFGCGSTPALLYRVVNEEPDLAQVPARLRPLIERCLAKDPAYRPTPADIIEIISDQCRRAHRGLAAQGGRGHYRPLQPGDRDRRSFTACPGTAGARARQPAGRAATQVQPHWRLANR